VLALLAYLQPYVAAIKEFHVFTTPLSDANEREASAKFAFSIKQSTVVMNI